MPGLFGLPTIEEISNAIAGIANPLNGGLGNTLDTARRAGESLGVPDFLLPGNTAIDVTRGIDAGVRDLGDAVGGLPSLPDAIRGAGGIFDALATGGQVVGQTGQQTLQTVENQSVTEEDINRLMQFIQENGITGITRKDLERQAQLGIVLPALQDAVTAQGQLESQRGFFGTQASRLEGIATDPSALRTDSEFSNRLASVENSLTASDQGFQRDINQFAASTGAGGISGRANELIRARQFQTGLAKGQASGALQGEAGQLGRQFRGMEKALPSQVSFTDPFSFTKGIQAADIGAGSQLTGIGLLPAQLGINALGTVISGTNSNPFVQVLGQRAATGLGNQAAKGFG